MQRSFLLVEGETWRLSQGRVSNNIGVWRGQVNRGRISGAPGREALKCRTKNCCVHPSAGLHLKWGAVADLSQQSRQTTVPAVGSPGGNPALPRAHPGLVLPFSSFPSWTLAGSHLPVPEGEHSQASEFQVA